MNNKLDIVINRGTPKEEHVSIDARVINFGVEILNGDNSDVYELPQ